MEAVQQAMTTLHAHPQEPQWDTLRQHSYPELSLRAETSTSVRYLDWYSPLERYTSYGVDQAERVVEEIGRLERWMNDFTHVQTEMQASIDSQTSMMHDLFGHFRLNHDA
jgi:hypothetical protein